MPIIRHLPGEVVPWTGTYALVGHYGEHTGVSVWLHAEERLPLVLVAADVEYPVWFFLIDEAVAKVA